MTAAKLHPGGIDYIFLRRASLEFRVGNLVSVRHNTHGQLLATAFFTHPAATVHPMYKPWPRCPKCTSPMTLTQQRTNVQGEKKPSTAPFECRPCDLSIVAVKPRPDIA